MTTNSGITKEWVDETVKPGDDFFRHVNGKWLATHEIPADRPKDGGLYTLRDNAEKHVASGWMSRLRRAGVPYWCALQLLHGC